MLPHWSEPPNWSVTPCSRYRVQEVHRLEQHVAELRVADARLQPPPHRVPGEHPVDREVLADVAQEVDDRQRRRVQSWLLTTVAALSPSKETKPLTWRRTRSVQSATVSAELSVRSPESRGSPIMPVAPPTRTYGVCPASWSRRAVSSWTQVAHVQARGGRVEAHVEPDAPVTQRRAERVGVGRERDRGRATRGRRERSGRLPRGVLSAPTVRGPARSTRLQSAASDVVPLARGYPLGYS